MIPRVTPPGIRIACAGQVWYQRSAMGFPAVAKTDKPGKTDICLTAR